jgi:hypothetical protein
MDFFGKPRAIQPSAGQLSSDAGLPPSARSMNASDALGPTPCALDDPRDPGEAEERAARRKWRRYFRRMGFERIGTTRFDGLSLARVRPTLADLLKPGR